jgi:hypothetical protein
MTLAEISDYLHAEEPVPVEFLQSCPGLGFLVNEDRDEAEIPQTYRASLPFWLAAILGSRAAGANRLVQINEPPWLRALGPGAHVDVERSFDYAATVAVACGDDSAAKRVIELAKERLPEVVTLALQFGRTRIDAQPHRVLFTEERDILAASHAAVQSFHKWKTGR